MCLFCICIPTGITQPLLCSVQFSSVQFSRSVMSNSLQLRGPRAAHQDSISITNSRSLLKLMSIEAVVPSNHLILCCPLLLPPSIFPSIRVFQMSQLFASGGQSSGVSASTSVLPMNTQDWCPLGWTGWISTQSKGLSKSLLQHHSSKASIVRRSAFFIVQISYPYMTSGKTIALTRQTFVDKVTSLLLNMLSRLVITFLRRSKRLLISWLQSPSVVILEPKKARGIHLPPGEVGLL